MQGIMEELFVVWCEMAGKSVSGKRRLVAQVPVDYVIH